MTNEADSENLIDEVGVTLTLSVHTSSLVLYLST